LRIEVNGESREVPDRISLQSLIANLELPAERVAVELNRSVIRRVAWSNTILKEGDQVEIVHFVGGG
jgi:sulfur carrier protein